MTKFFASILLPQNEIVERKSDFELELWVLNMQFQKWVDHNHEQP